VPDDAGLAVGTASYPAPFTCAIARANIFAVQFHPEKSQRAGLRLLANFVAWDGNP
jgi:glutamine amidotransferase